MLCGLLVMDSCIKDPASELSGVPDGAIMLTSEGYSNSNGAKTSVSGESVQWKSDDKVKINDNDYVVTVTNEGKAYITQGDNPLSGELHGYSPNTLSNPAWNSESKTITVDFPSFFISSFDGTGRQIIDLPMVAYSPTTDMSISGCSSMAARRPQTLRSLRGMGATASRGALSSPQTAGRNASVS